jgi:hypothetical protein
MLVVAGFIGTVCMAISAYYDVQEADTLHDEKEASALRAHGWTQFGLAITEGVLILGSILAEALCMDYGCSSVWAAMRL